MEWNDLPPARPIPQALVDRALAASRPRDGQGAWAGVARSAGTKLQHFATISGGLTAQAVTGLGVHDNVIQKDSRRRFFSVKRSDSSTNDARRLDDLTKNGCNFLPRGLRNDLDLE
jgi:hypothetical protein